MTGLENYYNQERDIYLIEIKLIRLQQLFNSLDPSPFLEKDLDDDAEAYILQAASEFPSKVPIKLVFYVPEPLYEEALKVVPNAIHNYFEYRSDAAMKEIRYILRQGRTSLMIGLVFLGLCLSLNRILSLLHDSVIVNIFTEGLLIIGWVAMWRPLEIFLYDWFPIYQNQRIYQKLSHITIEIRQFNPTIEGSTSSI